MVDQVLGRGRAKAAVTVLRGPQVDLMIMPPGEAGTYLVHFTGSADHNIRLRGIARDRGWSLSEKGFVRIDDEGKALEGDAADLRTFEDEAGVVRVPRPRLDPARAPRGPRRGGGGARRDASPSSSRSATCAATSTATPSGATASTRSRSWPRRRGGAATATRC